MINTTDMTTREFYAVHAPVDIPQWFDSYEKHSASEPSMSHLDKHEQETVRAVCDGEYDLPVEGVKIERTRMLEQAIGVRREFFKYLDWCNYMNAVNRFFAWRWYFADMMLRTNGSAAAFPKPIAAERGSL